MPWYNFIDIGMPLVFSPKVTPDPIDAERLEEKLQAARHLGHDMQQKRIHMVVPPPNSIVTPGEGSPRSLAYERARS